MTFLLMICNEMGTQSGVSRSARHNFLWKENYISLSMCRDFSVPGVLKAVAVCRNLIRVDSGRRRQVLARSQALRLPVRGAFRSILARL
jgi:hypothetical protein